MANEDTQEAAGIRYTRTVFVTSLLMIVTYAVVLVKVCKGSRYLWVIVLILMLMVSNLCAILVNTFANQ